MRSIRRSSISLSRLEATLTKSLLIVVCIIYIFVFACVIPAVIDLSNALHLWVVGNHY